MNEPNDGSGIVAGAMPTDLHGDTPITPPSPTPSIDIDALQNRLKDAEELAKALKELRALVEGECPSLLNEDSGGDSKLEMQIEEALAKWEANKS